ncbi:MAG: hypothetical protein RL398_1773, partial [Planctomycetota bacterium]
MILPRMPSPSQRTAPSAADAARELAHRRHWRAGVRLTMALLAVWAVAGLGCGVLFADALADVRLGGFPLGFWFAQQGSILTFLLVVLVYA